MNQLPDAQQEALIQTTDGDYQAQKNEALELKDCFTRYSFQAIGFIGIVIGLSIKYDEGNRYIIGFATVIVLSVLTSVARLGIHKYTGSNRIYGFDLFLGKVRRINGNRMYQNALKLMSWQELIRAYRIVQPIIYKSLYHSSPIGPEVLKREEIQKCTDFDNVESAYYWFLPHEMAQQHNGGCEVGAGYLWKMLSILYLLGFLTLAAFAMSVLRDSIHTATLVQHLELNANTVYTFYLLLFLVSPFIFIGLFSRFHSLIRSSPSSDGRIPQNAHWILNRGAFAFVMLAIAIGFLVLISTVVFDFPVMKLGNTMESLENYQPVIGNMILWLMFIGCSIFFVFRYIRDYNQRLILDGELLSIHSSSIVWHITIKCHLQVVESISKERTTETDIFYEYHKRLAKHASEMLGDNEAGRAKIINAKRWLAEDFM